MDFIETVEYGGKQVCFAHEMYRWFEVETTFEKWVEEFLFQKPKFDQTVDFEHCLTKMGNAEFKDDYMLQMDCAIEVSMLQLGKKGREARQFYIDCEKATLPDNAKDTLPGFFSRLQNFIIDNKAKEDFRRLIEDLENGFRE